MCHLLFSILSFTYIWRKYTPYLSHVSTIHLEFEAVNFLSQKLFEISIYLVWMVSLKLKMSTVISDLYSLCDGNHSTQLFELWDLIGIKVCQSLKAWNRSTHEHCDNFKAVIPLCELQVRWGHQWPRPYLSVSFTSLNEHEDWIATLIHYITMAVHGVFLLYPETIYKRFLNSNTSPVHHVSEFLLLLRRGLIYHRP